MDEKSKNIYKCMYNLDIHSFAASYLFVFH